MKMKVTASKNYNHDIGTIKSLRKPDRNDVLEYGSTWLYQPEGSIRPLSLFFSMGNGYWNEYQHIAKDSNE